MSKRKVTTSKKNLKNVSFRINLLKSTKSDFVVTNSNYTTYIDLPNGNRHKFIKEKMSVKTFAAFSKIKSDINKLNLDYDSLFEQFNLTNGNLYFNSLPRIENFKEDGVINIDIKGAYGSSLYNLGFISQETLEYIFSLPKKERLACVGMLASKKIETFFVEGKPQRFEIHTSIYRNVFFVLVRWVDKVMLEIADALKRDFIFFWVDGIYMRKGTPKNKVEKVKEILMKYNFDFHIDILSDFKLKNKSNKIIITFLKDSENKRFVFKDRNKINNTDIFLNHLSSRVKK